MFDSLVLLEDHRSPGWYIRECYWRSKVYASSSEVMVRYASLHVYLTGRNTVP